MVTGDTLSARNTNTTLTDPLSTLILIKPGGTAGLDNKDNYIIIN